MKMNQLTVTNLFSTRSYQSKTNMKLFCSNRRTEDAARIKYWPLLLVC